jgi:outer membrane protein OmpA-like peptidoglycan-associated protein
MFGSIGNYDPERGAVAIDSSGNIFTAAAIPNNAQSKSIAKITSAGTVTTQWTSALPDYSYGVAIGPGGTVFSGQYASIVKLDASGGLVATYTNSGPAFAAGVAVNATTGDAYWIKGQGNFKEVGRIPGGSSSANVANLSTPVSTTETPCAVITDASGNVYVGTSTDGKVIKFDSSLNRVTSYTVGQQACSLAVDATYLYVANKDSGSVSRITLSDGTTNATWANLGSLKPTYIAVDSAGSVYTANVPMGFGNSTISKISPAGTPTELYAARSQMETIKGLVVDAATNVYFTQGAGMTQNSAGVYKIAQAAPAPAPTTPAAATTTTTSGELPKGPALRVADIPKTITVDIGTSDSGTVAPNQPITAEVPCAAPEGTTLSSCTVNITAPQTVLLGQGDGISVRADKRVSIGRATVNAKGGKKIIVVKVKINQTGRKALQRNMKITAKVGLTAVTVARQSSTGEATTEMQLPTQLLSPQAGIFSSNSTTLNAAGVAFVNRLAALLPKSPKKMVFIGFADNTGVPGDNRWLGDRRAKAVRAALEAKGIVAVKSEIETKAARSPRDDNAKESGRERNRRVSIRITY